MLPEVDTPPELLAQHIQETYERGKPHAIVVVAEGAKYNAEGLCQYFEKHGLLLGFEFRSSVLGYVQRGASPTCADRLLGTRLGYEAVEEMIKGNTGVLVGVVGGEVVTTPLSQVVKGKKPLDPWFLKAAEILAR
jgi:6-phosphofructokinase 1